MFPDKVSAQYTYQNPASQSQNLSQSGLIKRYVDLEKSDILSNGVKSR